jgi:hypothetical protein
MCIQSGRLCATCEELYDVGEITDIDIDFGKVLMNVAKSQRFLSDITVNKMIETTNKIFLIVKKGDREKCERAKSELDSQFAAVDKRPVYYIEKIKNAKQLLDELLNPIIPVGTSTVFLPPFSEKELKIQVHKQDKDKLEMKADELSIITKALLDMNSHYVFV